VRVLDLATERAELAGRMLADLGAEVLKVEPPGGARARRRPPFDERPGVASDERSLYWAAVALGKRSVVIDLDDAAGAERLRALAASADVLIESFDPGALAARGLDYAALSPRHPGLVYVSVTPYGQSGPHAMRPATDLTLEAAGGLVGLQGDGDRPPVPVGFPQAAFHAGLQAAADAVIALNERDRSGLGQHLDVSMQAAVVWTLMQTTGFPPNTGGDPPHTGAERRWPTPDRLAGGAVPRVVECADGWASAQLTLGRGGTWAAALRWRDEEAGIDPELRAVDWLTWDVALAEGRLSAELVERGRAEVLALFRSKTKQELMDWAVANRLLVAPILTTADLLRDPHLRARDFWREIGGRTHPGPVAVLSRTPLGPRGPAPALGADQHMMERWLSEPPPFPPSESKGAAYAGERSRAPVAGGASHARGDAFDDVRVADFAWVGVGPLCTKALADHGATVVRLESAARPDGLRNAHPFKDNVQGIDRSQFYANFNSSKLSLSVNLACDAGRELARRMVAWSNVVVESFAPGAMRRLGLDYATLRRERPELIMLSTCLRGQTGPDAPYRGVGYQGSALSGIHGVTGWPDRPPSGPWGAYTDFVTPRYGAAVLAAAIRERRRTGLGQYIDLSQVEAGIHFVEPLVLDHTVNGRVAPPAGHDSAIACPHGVYAVGGVERYVAVAVETAPHWRALRDLVPALARFDGDRFDALAARMAQREAIDAGLRGWLAAQEPWAAVERLAVAGVPAAVVQRPSDLYRDPQLAHREFFVTLDHSVMGPTPYDGLVTRFSAKPVQLRKAAPALGEDTQHVLRDLLGCSDGEVAAYAERGALG